MSKISLAGNPGWYYRISEYFKKEFGQSVYKIPIHAGFNCPNRDGAISKSGCTYCYNPSFSYRAGKHQIISVKEQINRGKRRKNNALYLAYFQSYSNTYAPLETLKALYDEATADQDVVGLSIATRPDCVSEEVLNLVQTYNEKKLVWIEYGLQTKHDQTLKSINRGHDYNTFTKAFEATRKRKILICAHIILGLPGETTSMMLDTVTSLNQLKIDGIKFHHLQVIKHTEMARDYENNKFITFEKSSDYIPLLADCIERLSSNIVIHRLASQVVDNKMLIAPRWPESSGEIATALTSELRTRNSWQGKKQN